MGPYSSFEAAVDAIEGMLLAGEHRAALRAADRCLKSRPEAPSLLALRASALAGLPRRRGTARREARAALEAGPDDARCHRALADALRGSRRNATAVRLYRRALELDPADALSHLGLAAALAAIGGHQEAREHVLQATPDGQQLTRQ